VELVWSSGKGLSPLVIMEGKLDRWGYVDILEKHLLPYIQQNFKGKGYNFQQNNTPIHRAKDVTDWINQNNIKMLSNWPSQSLPSNIYGINWTGVFANEKYCQKTKVN